LDIQCGHRLISTHLSARPTPPGRRVPSSSHVKNRPAREDGNERYTDQPIADLQNTPTGNAKGGDAQHAQPNDAGSTGYRVDTGSHTDEAPVDTTPGLGSQERFDEEVMIYYQTLDSSLASQFLNLDDEPLTCTDQMMTTDIDYSMTPSSSLLGINTGATMEWELEPTSLDLLDTAKFETATDFADGEKTTPWPWGDYRYRPSTPPSYLDPMDYVAEFQLAEMEEELRDELMEAMVEDAILDGKIQQREREEMRRVEREGDHTATVAFNNQVVRGRTIYNP